MQSQHSLRSRIQHGLGDLRGRAAWVVFGCLVCQLGLGYGYVLGPMAGEIIGELDWTRAMYSAARAPQLFVTSLTSPLLGWLVIRHGSRRILLASIVLLGVAFVLLSRLQHLWQLYALVMLQGLTVTGLGDITVGQLASQWVKRGRGLALGIVYTGSNLGGYLMLAVGGWATDTWSWRAAFVLMGLSAFGVMLPIAWLTAHPPSTARATGLPAGRAIEPSGEGVEPPPDDEEADSMGATEALRTRTFWILAFSLFTFFFYFLGIIDCLVLFLTDHGMPRADAFHYFQMALGLGIVSKVALGVLADRIPHERAIQIDYALLATSSMILLLLPGEVWIWPFVLTYGFSTAARDVVYPLIITRCFGLLHMAEIYGVLMLALVVGGASGPVFAAAIHDRFGSYELAFQTFAALNLVAALGLLFVRDERAPRRAV